jgi:hypothetical protein
MTAFTTDEDISRLARRVLDTSLPHVEWTHAAHFALALWVLRHRPERSDPESFRSIIIRLNEAHGTPNTDTSGYHHTITIASLRVAAARLADHGEHAPLAGILVAMMAGVFGRSDWILAYWSRELLFSTAARRNWVEPDIAPLPF